jgi:hypothetical protein
MKQCWVFMLLVVLAAGCSDKRTDLSGAVPVKPDDFLAVFKPIVLPISASDTNINRFADTVTIGYAALQQFFPDSALQQVIGKDSKQTIHPVGKIQKGKDAEIYLLLNFTNRKKKTRMAVFVVDKKTKFLASKTLLSTDSDDGYLHTLSINREPTFLLGREKANADNSLQYTKSGWVYNDAGLFMIVINDSNEDPKKAVVINPLDTLPRKNKFSGDYIRDKKNFISIRDSKKPGTYLFFVHFEKNEGSCIGELKGEMRMTGNHSAQYTSKGDPCVIDFTFEGSEITMKETGTCGNRRGIRCFFNDSFIRRRK